AESPCAAGSTRQFFRRNIRMNEQQGIGALGPGEMRNLFLGPWRGNGFIKDACAVDINLFVRDYQQISLLGVEFESDELAVASDRVDIAQARTTCDAARRINKNVAKFLRAVFIGP